jgi:hypothetical protein
MRVLHTVCLPVIAAAGRQAPASPQHYVTVQSIRTWENGFNCSKELCRHYTAYSDREHSYCGTLCLITRRRVQQYWRSKWQAACLAFMFHLLLLRHELNMFLQAGFILVVHAISASNCTWLHPGDKRQHVRSKRRLHRSSYEVPYPPHKCLSVRSCISNTPPTHQTKRYMQT